MPRNHDYLVWKKNVRRVSNEGGKSYGLSGAAKVRSPAKQDYLITGPNHGPACYYKKTLNSAVINHNIGACTMTTLP